MANNRIQIKRTSISGRAANSTTLSNAGELALNMTDGIMYSTNGSVVFEIGANNTNVNVSNTLTVKAISANGSNGTSGQVLTSNGTSSYWSTVSGGGGGSVAGSNTQVQFNDSGAFGASAGFVFDKTSNNLTLANTVIVGNSTVNASHTATLLQVSNSTITTNVTPLGLVVGANMVVNTSAVFIGNSTVNSTHDSTLVQVSNSTSTANLNPLSLTIGSAVVNSSTLAIGASIFANTTTLQMSDQTLLRPTIKDYALTRSDIGNATGSVTIDLTNGNFFTATTTGTTTWTFSNPPSGTTAGGFVLELTNGGSQTQNWPAATKWPGGTAPTLTASGVDVLVFITDDGGTTYRGVASMLDSK